MVWEKVGHQVAADGRALCRQTAFQQFPGEDLALSLWSLPLDQGADCISLQWIKVGSLARQFLLGPVWFFSFTHTWGDIELLVP